MARQTSITGEGIRDETVDSADIASGSIKAGELSPQSISGQATIGSTDTTNDRLLIWDATDSALKQVSIGNLGVAASPAGADAQIQYNNDGSAGGASKLLYDDSNHRLGVGSTDAPSNTLTAYADASNAYVALINNDAGSNAHGLKVTTDGTGTGTTILDIEAGSTTVFKVRGDGRVGIGVATPGSTLSVDDEIAVGEKLIHRGDPDTYLQFPSNDNITFAAGGSEELKIASDAILVKQYIKHDGDEDTFINFLNDKIVVKAGDIAMVTAEQKDSAPHEVTINDGSNNIDFVVKGNGSNRGNPLFACDASTGRVGINGVGSPDYELDVDGDIGVSGSIIHRGDADTYIKFEDDTIELVAGSRGFIKLEEASQDKLIINHGALDIDLKVGGENNANLIRTEAAIDSVYFGGGSAAGVDNNFWVSGSVGSKGTATRGTAVFGGDAVISGSLHVKGGNTVGGATSAAIILDSTTSSKIVWDSEDDGNSPDSAIYESGGSLYLSSSNDIRIYAGTDDILLYPKDMLQIIEDENASGNFASFFAQPSDGVYYNVLDIGDTGVTINDDSRADYDFRVESDSNTHMVFVDAGNNTVGINSGTPKSTLSINGSLALSVLNINAANDPGTSYTIANTDCVILVNTRPTDQGGIDSAITLTLPDASDHPGMVITVKDSAGYANVNNIIVSRAGSDTIEGVATTLTLNNVAQKTTLISDGTSVWSEIGN